MLFFSVAAVLKMAQRLYLANLPWWWSWEEITNAVHTETGVWPTFVKKHERRNTNQDLVSAYIHVGKEVDVNRMVRILGGCWFSHKRCLCEDATEVTQLKTQPKSKAWVELHKELGLHYWCRITCLAAVGIGLLFSVLGGSGLASCLGAKDRLRSAAAPWKHW